MKATSVYISMKAFGLSFMDVNVNEPERKAMVQAIRDIAAAYCRRYGYDSDNVASIAVSFLTAASQHDYDTMDRREAELLNVLSAI